MLASDNAFGGVTVSVILFATESVGIRKTYREDCISSKKSASKNSRLFLSFFGLGQCRFRVCVRLFASCSRSHNKIVIALVAACFSRDLSAMRV